MKVFDFHTHIFPDALASRALEKLAHGSDLVPFSDGTLLGTVDYAKREGVDRILMLSIATNAAQQTKVNDFAISVQNSGLAESFGSVFPNSDSALDELLRLKKAGLKGIKLHPEYQAFDLDDPVAFPIYETCISEGLVVVIHAGTDLAFPSSLRAGVLAIKEVHKNFPQLKLVAAHFGGFLHAESVLETLAGLKGLYFDTSFSVGYVRTETAEQLIRKHGAENILFASDCPWGSPSKHIQMIEELNLTPQDKELIFYKNAERLIGLA